MTKAERRRIADGLHLVADTVAKGRGKLIGLRFSPEAHAALVLMQREMLREVGVTIYTREDVLGPRCPKCKREHKGKRCPPMAQMVLK